MHEYTIIDRKTGESTKLVAPNRDAALKAYVKNRLQVARVTPAKPAQGPAFELPGERTAGAVG